MHASLASLLWLRPERGYARVREFRELVIARLDGREPRTLDDRSDDYVEALFDHLVHHRQRLYSPQPE
jgi:hypothetical protein